MRQFASAFVIGLCVLSAGCKPPPPPKPPLLQTMAVLPFDSESNNIDAPDIMQQLVFEALSEGPYRVTDIKDTNQLLADKGIHEGGQLAASDPKKIGTDLGVQGVMYGDVESFGYKNIAIYAERKVTLSLRLVDVLTGQTLWEGHGAGTTRDFAFKKGEAGGAFFRQLAQEAAEKISKKPLAMESRLATLQALQTLPGCNLQKFRMNYAETKRQHDQTQEMMKAVIK